jgi:hypothetical protein
MALGRAESHITNISVYELQTVGKLHIQRLTISLLTILLTDCSFYSEDRSTRSLLNVGEFLPAYTVPQNSTLRRNRYQNLTLQTTKSLCAKTLLLMIGISGLCLSGKLKESLSMIRQTTSYPSIQLFYASKLWQIWRLDTICYIEKFESVPSALQHSFSNMKWCNICKVGY